MKTRISVNNSPLYDIELPPNAWPIADCIYADARVELHLNGQVAVFDLPHICMVGVTDVLGVVLAHLHQTHQHRVTTTINFMKAYAVALERARLLDFSKSHTLPELAAEYERCGHVFDFSMPKMELPECALAPAPFTIPTESVVIPEDAVVYMRPPDTCKS